MYKKFKLSLKLKELLNDMAVTTSVTFLKTTINKVKLTKSSNKSKVSMELI